MDHHKIQEDRLDVSLAQSSSALLILMSLHPSANLIAEWRGREGRKSTFIL